MSHTTSITGVVFRWQVISDIGLAYPPYTTPKKKIMKTLFDHVFSNIDLFDNLDEIKDWCVAELRRRHINAVAEYSGRKILIIEDEDYIDADEWVEGKHFLRHLISDPRCPRWLEKHIVWHILKDNKYW